MVYPARRMLIALMKNFRGQQKRQESYIIMENGWGGGAWIRGSVHTSEVKRKVFSFFLNTAGVSTLFSALSRGFQSFGTAFLKALAPDRFLFCVLRGGKAEQ